MIERIFGILSYLAAGFFLYSLQLGAFVSGSQKWQMLGQFAAIAVIAFLVGCVFFRFRGVSLNAGIVVLGGATITLFVLAVVGSLIAFGQFRETLSPDANRATKDYLVGFSCLASSILSGIVLVRIGLRKRPNQALQPTSMTRSVCEKSPVSDRLLRGG